jgi:hypothetical protein
MFQKFPDTFRCLDTFVQFGHQGHAHAPGAGIAAMGIARQIAAG